MLFELTNCARGISTWGMRKQRAIQFTGTHEV